MSPYRRPDPPSPFLEVVPDPFPQEEYLKEQARLLEERRMRAVAHAARRLVSVTKTATSARVYFCDSPKLLDVVEREVERAFARLHQAVESWEKKE